MIIVRPSLLEDSEDIRRVSGSATATLRKTYRPNQKALKIRRKLFPQLSQLVALIDGQIIGTTQFYIDGETIRIIGLFVHSDHRNKGVARALVSEIIDIAHKQGLSYLSTSTVKETGNIPIFKKLGFEVISESPDEYSESDKYSSLTDVDLKLKIK